MASVRTIVAGGLGRGVEVDAQLVRMVDIVRSDGPWVQVEAAQVDDPGEVGNVAR